MGGKEAELSKVVELYNELVMVNQALIAKLGTTVITPVDWGVLKQLPKERRKVTIKKVADGMELSSAYTRNLDLVRNVDAERNPAEQLGAGAGADGGRDDGGGDRDPSKLVDGPSEVGASTGDESSS